MFTQGKGSIKSSTHPAGTEFVELPRTVTRRGAMACAAVILSVSLNPNLIGMLAWRGKHYRPGQRITEQELLGISKNPVVLELTEVADDEGKRRCWRMLKVLWRYDRERKSFVELARFQPPCSYSDMEMRKLAARVMKQDVWRELESVEESAERIERYLSTELYQLGNRRRPVLESVLHQLLGRLVQESGAVDLAVPVASDSLLVT